jgi:transmembrane sensor
MPDSPENNSCDREPTPVEQAALTWVVRCDAGLSAEQEREFADWLRASPQHRDLFEEFGGTWALMGRWSEAKSSQTPAAVTGAIPFEHRVEGSHPVASTWSRAWRIGLPIAAAVVVIISAYLGWRRPAQQDILVTTEVGVSRRLELPDGSVVTLNTDSTVVTAFNSTERRLRLEKGEAYFEVAKDARRPFVVEASGAGIRAIGTAFNVRVRPESVEVLVTEGKVRVAQDSGAGAGALAAPTITTGNADTALPAPGWGGPADAAEVEAGERAIISVSAMTASTPALGVARVSAEEIQRLLAWQSSRLVFSDTSLEEMVAEFNRYNRNKLTIADANIATMRFGGSFQTDDRLGFVRMLRKNFGISAEERADQTILRGRH